MVIKGPTIQFLTGIPEITQENSYSLTLTENYCKFKYNILQGTI